MAARTFLPPIPYTSTKQFAPTGYKRKPTEAFFSKADTKSFKGPTAESDLRDTSAPSGQKKLKKGKGKKKNLTWGKLSVKDPERDIITQNRVARTEAGQPSERTAGAYAVSRAGAQPTNASYTSGGGTVSQYGSEHVPSQGESTAGQLHTTSDGAPMTNTESAASTEPGGTTVVTQTADAAAQGVLNSADNDVDMADADGPSETLGTANESGDPNGVSAEGRHVEATGLNMSDDWVPHTVKGDAPAYKVDAASLAFETIAGDVRGFKNLSGNKTNNLKTLTNDNSIVRSIMDGAESKHDYSLSMLDVAVATTEDPFGKRKWNPKPVQNVMNMSVRGLITINHEGALMKKRGMNQFRNQNIRRPEPDFSYEEVEHVDRDLSGWTDPNLMIIHGVAVDKENQMFYNAPSGNQALNYHDQNAQGQGADDEIADRITAATMQGARNNYSGEENRLRSDGPWTSGRGWQARQNANNARPWDGDNSQAGFGRSGVTQPSDGGAFGEYGASTHPMAGNPTQNVSLQGGGYFTTGRPDVTNHLGEHNVSGAAHVNSNPCP